MILLFSLLLLRGVTLAAHAPDRFGALLVVGFVVQVALQAVLNIAVVTNTIPNTGISLPFFSSGGTSLMMLLGEMGIVLSVSRGENIKAAISAAKWDVCPAKDAKTDKRPDKCVLRCPGTKQTDGPRSAYHGVSFGRTGVFAWQGITSSRAGGR